VNMTLTTRLAIAMIALVAITVSAVGWLSYHGLEQAILPRVLDRIETHARLVAADLQSSVRGARADVTAFRSAAALNGLIRAHVAGGVDPVDGLSEKTWHDRIEERLSAELEAKPAYAEFRIIGLDDGQREIVRADRTGPNGAVRLVPSEELQRKGDRNYFKETIRLRPGAVYVSPLNLTGDNGVIKTPHVPTLRIATPIFTPDGNPFGIVIINVDMRPAFDRVRSSVRQGGKIYVVNARGDYLIHPDPAQEFGSQLGKPINWRADFPDLASSLGAVQSLSQIERDQSGHPGGIALAPTILAGSEWLAVVESVSNAVFMAPAAAIQNTSMLVGFIAVLCAAALAVLVARSLIRPISQLTTAVEGIGRNDPTPIPVDAGGETGVLARAFARVMGETSAKTAALEREVEDHRRTAAARDHHAQRERLFSAAVESSNDAIITNSLDGIITGWNPAAERLFGFTSAEAVGKGIDIIVPPDRLGEMHDILSRVGGGETIEHLETLRLHKNGNPVEVSLGVSPIRSRSGAVVGASKTARDISESKRAREALLESEQLARGIIDTALDAFVQIGESGVVLDWNSQAEMIFGWSREDAIGKDFSELIIAETDRDDLNAALKRFLHSGHDQILGRRREIAAVRRDGKEFRAEMSVTALKRRDGFLFNAFFRDLTEKIAAEERIRQTEKMEALGQLTGGIAHDFNNILTVITGTIEILAEAIQSQPKLLEIATMIDRAAARGANLTHHLLSFARKQPLEPKETDINTLIIDTAKLLRPTLGEQIEIESVFEDEVCLATVDPNQLSTALLNLAINARDAMPDGGKLIIETRSVHLDDAYASRHSEVRPGRYALIAVSDTGAGIPAAILDKVFDPFFTSKEPGKGTGLGLSMVYGFVKQSAGHIKIYSEEGQGTTIKIYLPPGTGASLDSDAAIASVIVGGHEQILVVEDDELVRDYVIAQLHTLGYVTLPARNGAEGLAMIDAGTGFDLLFTDVIMPGGMNGRQLADEARKRRPLLKVLFTSGYTEDAIIHHGRLDPGVLLLAKPYRKSDLARMIRRALTA
jgi:PAS domain S-box-containing protein